MTTLPDSTPTTDPVHQTRTRPSPPAESPATLPLHRTSSRGPRTAPRPSAPHTTETTSSGSARHGSPTPTHRGGSPHQPQRPLPQTPPSRATSAPDAGPVPAVHPYGSIATGNDLRERPTPSCRSPAPTGPDCGPSTSPRPRQHECRPSPPPPGHQPAPPSDPPATRNGPCPRPTNATPRQDNDAAHQHRQSPPPSCRHLTRPLGFATNEPIQIRPREPPLTTHAPNYHRGPTISRQAPQRMCRHPQRQSHILGRHPRTRRCCAYVC